jgi:hypothetical protein
MPEDQLILTFIPSLVSLLLGREEGKGAPLTEEEVLEIRDKATVVALPPDVAAEVTRTRGYPDIDAGHCWKEWQQARLDLIKPS